LPNAASPVKLAVAKAIRLWQGFFDPSFSCFAMQIHAGE
jgi:hypothetical protein